MNFVYIDDTYLRSSPFLDTMKKRFFSYCQTHGIVHVFISGAAEGIEAEAFYEQCQKHQLLVIQSPAAFEIGPCKGVLSHTSLELHGAPPIVPYSGSIIVGDFTTNYMERVYFEFFLKQEMQSEEALFEEEIVDLLQDIIRRHKKTNQYH